MRSEVVVGEVCEMNELPTETDVGREAGTRGEGYDDTEQNAVAAADRSRSGASEAMAKE